MKHKYNPTPSQFVMPADSKISSGAVLAEITAGIIKSSQSMMTVDFSGVYWISPFTACWFAALKDVCEAGRCGLEFKPPRRENVIHQWFNLGIEKYLLPLTPPAPLPSHYATFPVTRLSEPSYPLAGRVTRLLTENLRGVENFHKALHFAIREVIENAFEHGQTDHCYMCAYSVPSRQVVRLCILDTGIGIPGSMRGSAKYSHITDDDLLVEDASRYGVSSKSGDRGIGLYLLRDVAEKNDAQLTILSGRAKIDITRTIRRTQLPIGFSGTAIELMLRTRQDFHYLTGAEWEAL